MRNSLRIAVAAAVMLGLGSAALAEGRSKAQRGASAGGRVVTAPSFSPSTRAEMIDPAGEPFGQVQIGETKPGEPHTVYWRGRNVGTDPDPVIRTQLLRHAISGGG